MKKLYFLFSFLMISCFTFSQVIITEIADPNNNANARFIELHNLGTTAVDFTEGNGWQIDKYTNASATVSISLDLTGTIPAGGFYIIAYDLNDAGEFQSTYGFAPDQLDNVNNGVAGSNGDDDIVLVDGTDTIVDFFGVPAVDNSSTCAEYEDGRAERLTSVTAGSATFDESQWNVWADSTVNDCTSHQNAPRTAPEDYDPGAWGTPTCGLSLSNPNATCDAITTGTDTYTATIDFNGGGTATYTVTADSGTVDLSAGNPTTDTTGTITVTGITEGIDVTINVQDGNICDVDGVVNSADCEPALTLPVIENFDYSDGSLTSNPNWDNFSGTDGDLLVASGQAVVQHGTPSEDASIAFDAVAGDIYYAFDFTVVDPGAPIAGEDYEYFALLKDDAFAFAARLDIVEANTSGNDFTVGIASDESTADAIWATDLSFDTTYRATVRYNQDSNIAELWIDASSSSDTSILGEDRDDPGITITQFALRQSDSSLNESVLVDNLVVSSNFNETLSNNEFNIITDFKLYPNPTNKGFVTITSSNADNLNVEVFDILGKQVKNQTLSNGRLDVSSLKTGVYIIKITQNNQTSTKKLVIN
ncbi:T9SS type A sorting domain-containing protein [uncultured Winogradskyella sp.]|uniref:T9SS type A sorting domain-containing protein n=1 Tax=uncultured Winogradskyella sp. TaxID=395353 RepID=UPI0026024ABB|nr:T9SS type A sorting domain-containing protein [uncultured Winogradskyella sp.]